MRQIWILLIFALLFALGFGLYQSWPVIEPQVEKIYEESPDPSYFEDEEPEPAPEQDDAVHFQFEEEEDYVALAISSIHADPKQSWDYLERAMEKDPKNPEVRIYRARMLEGVGKPSLAEKEYALAYAVKENDKPFADQYAGFMMRRGNYAAAEKLLREHLTPPSSDQVWLKAWFLSHVYEPVGFDFKKHRIPKGNATPLVHYVLTLKEGQFWDADRFERVPYRHEYLENEQITYWLQLLAALQAKQYRAAHTLLENNPFAFQSWNPQLEINLLRLIQYRLDRSLSLDSRSPLFARVKKAAQNITPLTFMLSELAEEEEMDPNYAVPNNIRPMLISDEIIALALLDSGWKEGAIMLSELGRFPPNFPKQASYKMAVALKENRGKLAALKFAENQEPTPELTLLIAEIRIELGDDDLALNELHHLSKEKGEVGLRASRIIAQTFMRQNDYEKAKQFITGTDHLKTDVSGQELLAQIFKEQNQPELAYQIYLNIERESPTAKSFLAHKAIKDREWTRAEQLTKELIAEFPKNKVYRRNLEIIREMKEQENDSLE